MVAPSIMIDSNRVVMQAHTTGARVGDSDTVLHPPRGMLSVVRLKVLPFSSAIAENLERVRAAGIVERVPNEWQIFLGVVRMWHRLLFRSDTVGTSRHNPVRRTWRARLLAPRPLRFPFLVAERAVAPLDFSGLASPPWRVVRHLLGAHHDGRQFAYDLELLRATHPQVLDEVLAGARAVVTGATPRAEWLRDLTVYERYHESLAEAVARAIHGDFGLTDDEARDPDISFAAYLRWCAAQPATPSETLQALVAGRYTIAGGIRSTDGTRPD
jgi:hypothetical protein